MNTSAEPGIFAGSFLREVYRRFVRWPCRNACADQTCTGVWLGSRARGVDSGVRRPCLGTQVESLTKLDDLGQLVPEPQLCLL